MFIKKTAVLVMVMMLTMGGVAGAKELKPKTNVPIKKSFELIMSGNVKESTVEGNITVTTEDKKPVEIDTFTQGKYIEVTPIGKYKPGTTYYLRVSDKVRDTKNRKFKEYVSFKFTTAGKPVKEEDIVKKPIGLPVGATIKEKDKYYTKYNYRKSLPGGAEVNSVHYGNYGETYGLIVKLKNGREHFATYYPEEDTIAFWMVTEIPVSNEQLKVMYEIGREFASYRSPYE